MRKFTKRSVAVFAAVAVAAGGGTAAYAFWTSSDTAEATGKTGSAKPLEIISQQVIGTLAPGNPVDVRFRVKNPNNYKVNGAVPQITSVTAACDWGSTFAVNTTTTPAAIGEIGANATTGYIVWTDAVKLTANPSDGCQDKDYTVTISVTADSAAA